MNRAGQLIDAFPGRLKINEPLSLHTSWGVGGPADYFFEPQGREELALVMRLAAEDDLPLTIIGRGSNLLVRDGGIRGLVVSIGPPFHYLQPRPGGLVAGAGTPMTELARVAAASGYAGLEFAAGIPGSLGGAVIMNAGAFGSSLGEFVQEVALILPGGEELRLRRPELFFGYRSSNLAGRGALYEVSLDLDEGEAGQSLSLIDHYLAERRRRHPRGFSAGSVFRNPKGKAAGRLIEECGGKGLCSGGAEVSRQHANFIINTGEATARDILNLIDTVHHLVLERHGVSLVLEVKILGEEKSVEK